MDVPSLWLDLPGIAVAYLLLVHLVVGVPVALIGIPAG